MIALHLGAFGFLSSDEVSRYGTPNAGLYGQPSIFSSFPRAIQQRELVLKCRELTEQNSRSALCFAMGAVVHHVRTLHNKCLVPIGCANGICSLFGGDPSRVTIAGESAGGNRTLTSSWNDILTDSVKVAA